MFKSCYSTVTNDFAKQANTSVLNISLAILAKKMYEMFYQVSLTSVLKFSTGKVAQSKKKKVLIIKVKGRLDNLNIFFYTQENMD